MVWDVDRMVVLEHIVGAYSISVRCRVKGFFGGMGFCGSVWSHPQVGGL